MAETQKPTILIVEDEEETRTVYAELFRKHHFNVLEAKDGIEGLDLATAEEKIDLIITGIMMPRMDGFEMMKALRNYVNTSLIPVFVYSHLGREADRKRAFELGAKDFIIRDIVSPTETLKRILAYLGSEHYLLKIDPFELDGQRFIDDFKLVESFHCDNCGSELAIKLQRNQEQGFSVQIVCPDCKKNY